ncbi:V-type proton ATPase 16 kDa proteolipid subunit [Drechslerella dactyloides]|uniref:V-type proton ATPase 16 kDa proteolipid subunit n=1 Tax=Drechslerella dactyloides TaxID=74499 RepID=A0AAD6NHY8_DREDA|nr:V-type proton ATPase 16 kDa proteolipid subunit [Drechslerella dactyloides]
MERPFFGAMGCAASIIFCAFGASYGTAKSGVGVVASGVLRPDMMVKNHRRLRRHPKAQGTHGSIPPRKNDANRDSTADSIPVVMAGIVAIYGLVVSVLVSSNLNQKQTLYAGFIQLGAGLAVGLSGLAAGFAIGIVGDAGVRGTVQQPRLFVGMILILIFAEVLGLYGLIVALLMNSKAQEAATC